MNNYKFSWFFLAAFLVITLGFIFFIVASRNTDIFAAVSGAFFGLKAPHFIA